MFAPNWSVWLEWDHIFPQDTTLFLPVLVNPLSPTGAAETATIRRDFNKVLVGLNWRFGGVGRSITTMHPPDRSLPGARKPSLRR
jgi:hypothetical protein